VNESLRSMIPSRISVMDVKGTVEVSPKKP
jgi:hypothetical protein